MKVTNQWYTPLPSKVHTFAAFQMDNGLILSNEPPTMFPYEETGWEWIGGYDKEKAISSKYMSYGCHECIINGGVYVLS